MSFEVNSSPCCPQEPTAAADRIRVKTARVRASCPTCGEVEVRGTDLTIRCCIETMESMYRFRCTVCDAWTVKHAGPGVITLLLRAGARVERWRQPLEIGERPDSSVAPISDDDLIDFHEALERLPTATPEY